MTASSDSSHSPVSFGSMSGSWAGRPSLMIEKRSRPEATLVLHFVLGRRTAVPRGSAEAEGRRRPRLFGCIARRLTQHARVAPEGSRTVLLMVLCGRPWRHLYSTVTIANTDIPDFNPTRTI